MLWYPTGESLTACMAWLQSDSETLQHLFLHCLRWQTERSGFFEGLHSLDVAANSSGDEGLFGALLAPSTPPGHVPEKAGAQRVSYLSEGGLCEINVSASILAYNHRNFVFIMIRCRRQQHSPGLEPTTANWNVSRVQLIFKRLFSGVGPTSVG
jgi:hypothetical protein